MTDKIGIPPCQRVLAVDHPYSGKILRFTCRFHARRGRWAIFHQLATHPFFFSGIYRTFGHFADANTDSQLWIALL